MTSGGDPGSSVVIPVYNGERYLAEAIESVLGQTLPPLELIVVDDGSSDRSAEIARSFGPAVRYEFQANGGPAAAMNRGVALARGPLVAFLSADDLWVPEKLAWQTAALLEGGAVDLVFGHAQHFYSPELDAATCRTLRCPADPMPAYSAGTLLTRRDTFLRVGTFDERWRAGEFMDWYARATELGFRDVALPAVVLRRRVHGANHSTRTANLGASYARVLKATLDRRRDRQGLAE
jgi:glycosyltransferase involved in cell wall biosynthesis